MLRFFLTCCLIAVFQLDQAKAQPPCQYTLRGHIYDSLHRSTIQEVELKLMNSKEVRYSSNDGYFEWDNLCPGTYTLLCKKEGYKIESCEILLPMSSPLRIAMLSSNVYLPSVIISTKRAERVVEPEIKMNQEVLFHAQGQSIGKAMESLQGVYTISTGQSISKPVVHGLHSNRVLIINNGVKQEGQQWGNEHAPEIDPFQANEIRLISGPRSLQFGSDVLGGVILVSPNNIHTINQSALEFRSMVCSNGRGGAFSLLGEAPLNKNSPWHIRFQGTLKRIGNLQTPNYVLGNTGLFERDFSLTLGYKKKQHEGLIYISNFFTRLGILTTSHVGNLTDLYAAFQRNQPIDSSSFTYNIGFPFQLVNHQLAKASWSAKAGDWGRWHVQYSIQHNRRNEYDKTLQTQLPNGSYKPALDFSLITQQLDLYGTHNKSKIWHGQLGLMAQLQTNNYYGAYLVPNYVRYQTGVYVIQDASKGPWLFDWAIRYDVCFLQTLRWVNHVLKSNYFQFNGAAGLFGVRYNGQKRSVFLHGGTTWRAPHVNELFSYGVHHSAAAFEMGDSTLVPERSYQVNLGVEQQASRRIYWQLSVYGHFIHQFIYLKPVFPATLTLRGAFPTFQYTGIDAWLGGADAIIGTSRVKAWQVNSKGSYLFTRDTRTGKSLVGMPPARLEAELLRRFYLSSGDESKLSFKLRYTFKAQGLAFASDYVTPPPAYWLCGLWWDVGFHWQGVFWQAQIGADNLLNIRYRDYLNRYRYFANEPGRNVVLRLKTNLTSIPK